MGFPTSGANKAQQNVYLIQSAPSENRVPESQDPYILLNVQSLGGVLDGLYFFDPTDDAYHLLGEAAKTVFQGFGGLSYDGAAVPLVVGTTPVKITGFDTIQPATGPVDIGVDLANDEVDVTAVGVFQFFAQVTANITAGRSYVIEVFVNGAPTAIQAGLDASNQTTGVFLSINSMRSLTLGNLPAVVDLRVVASAAGSDFNILNAEFGVYRISSIGEGLQVAAAQTVLTTETGDIITTEAGDPLAIG